MYSKIIVALDGSDHARKALEVASRLAAGHDAELVLVHATSDEPLSSEEREAARVEYGMTDSGANPPVATVLDANASAVAGTPLSSTHPDTAALEVRREFGEKILQAGEREARKEGVKKVKHTATMGSPAKVILDAATSEKADLVIMGSRGLSDLEGLVFGSTSHEVAHKAPCTALTVC